MLLNDWITKKNHNALSSLPTKVTRETTPASSFLLIGDVDEVGHRVSRIMRFKVGPGCPPRQCIEK